MTSYHPTVEQLIEFSSGALPLSHALCISAHIDHCDECQQVLTKLDYVGASLFEEVDVQARDQRNLSDLKENVMALIANDNISNANIVNDDDVILAKDVEHDSSVPACLRQFVKGDWNDINWTSVSPSFRMTTLCKDKDGSEVALSCVKPGGRMPHHSHLGDELTVVLKGSFSDEDGVYVKGDFVQRNAKDKHTPVVTNDGECICLMVLDAPIQFTGFFTRLLNPFLRLRHSHA